MTDNFQILSLDGGGVKGIFSAAILAFLEDDLNIRIQDHFDLITGTSTGGIIALGLGFGMRPKEILSFYLKEGPQIFPKGLLKGITHYFGSKYHSKELERALKECFGEKILSESQKRLVIPSYNIGEDDIYLFKTRHHERLNRDHKLPAWKVAMATSAAPTYFPAFRKLNHLRLVDGGVWANNPIMVGIIDAISLLEVPLNSLKVFSIGTTDEIKGRSKKLDNGGLWAWKTDAIDVVMRSQSIGAYTQALHLLGQNNVMRVNPKTHEGLFSLDKLSVEEFISKADHESRIFSPEFKEKFMSHKAQDFKQITNNKDQNYDL